MKGQRKVVITILVKTAIVMYLCLLNPVHFREAFAATERALILYETEERLGESFPVVDAMEEYLGHFNLQVDRLPRSGWQPGLLSGYQVVIYLGTERTLLPGELLGEMEQVPRLLWVEKNIEQYADLQKWTGFAHEGRTYQLVALEYKQRRLTLPVRLPINVCYPGPEANIVALADDLLQKKPFAWQRKNIWYLGRIDFTGPISLIMADLLHEVCGQQHEERNQVLIRIEDVEPRSDPDKLSKLIDVMANKKLPYAVAVIPAAETPYGMVTLEDAPELVQVLKRVEQTGGSIIQHGYTHQNEFSPRTGEGFEFWNAKDDTVMPGDEEVFARERINNGLGVLAKVGIYPVAFEPPHYAMSGKGYKELARHYNVLSGQIQLSDDSYTITLTTPYTTLSKRTGMIFYPENLGYYEPDEVNAVPKILDKAEQLTIVRDRTAGFFYHNYFPPEPLARIINGLEDMGYQFIDLREAPFKVEGDKIKIFSLNGEKQVISEIAPTQGEQLSDTFERAVTSLAGLIALITVSFLLIAWWMVRNKRKLYERDQYVGTDIL